MNYELESMAANAIAHAANMTQAAFQSAAGMLEGFGLDLRRPCVIWRPALSVDGNQWCALYGEDLQNGVAGFGDTPEQAMVDFDVRWLNARAGCAAATPRADNQTQTKD